MICQDCAQAADLNAKMAYLNKNRPAPMKNPITAVHPHNCECTCQHRPSGSWNGTQETADEPS